MSDTPQDDFRAFVEARMQTMFAALYPGVPIKFGNSPFKQPQSSMWSEFYIMSGSNFKASLGRSFVERVAGAIQIDILVPENTGTSAGGKAAERAAGFFKHEDFRISGTQVCRFRRGGDIKDMGCNEGFHRTTARVIFEHDTMTVQP